ncbi:uncharacterized protein LOC116616177 [Nematostella vectensis]|uniref:uncharacterized protein LOC116616177 n=1 Tax=Nematostella vectensis TaxID=45351 RepID=UPI0013900EFF|nr:uncharacterized protein LOC116616177 [Nematostella vectensis]
MMGEYSAFVQTYLREILQSGRFNIKDCQSRNLHLSQAYCLLWQNPETGEVTGRVSDEIIHDAAVAAILLDLAVRGYVELCIQEKTFMMKVGIVSQGVDVKVTNPTPTDTFLDKALFTRILDSTMRSAGDWMIRTFSLKGGEVLTPILDSLVDQGIFSVESQSCMGRKYPIMNQGPKKELQKELQMIALNDHHADGFMWPLLKLARGVDALELGRAPILEHNFSDQDYNRAKKNIERLLKEGKPAETHKENVKV